jgi:hypothetical protein
VAEPDELTLAIARRLEMDAQYIEHVGAWDSERIAQVRSAGRRAGRLLGWKIQTFQSEPTDEGRVAVVVIVREWPDEETRRLQARALLLIDETFPKITPPEDLPG